MLSTEVPDTAVNSKGQASAVSRLPGLLLNVMSLDAPLLALLWQDTLAHSLGQRLTWQTRASLFAAVWTTYLADRMADSALPSATVPSDGERRSAWVAPRKQFSGTNRVWLCALLLAAAAGGGLCASQLPHQVLETGIALSGVVVAYLVLAQYWRRISQLVFPREWLVGLLFAIGCSVTFLSAPETRVHSLPYCFLLAGLCVVDLSLLEVWEWERSLCWPAPSGGAFLINGHLIRIGSALAAVAIGMAGLGWVKIAFAGAICLSLAVWMGVARYRQHVPADAITLAVDCALLSPLLFWW